MKQFLKKLIVLILEVAVIGGALWFVAEKKGITTFSQIIPVVEKSVQKQQAAPFPALQQPLSKKFAWKYKGENYALSMTLYQSVYAYYNSLPKDYSYVGSLPANWEDGYYGMFLKQNAADDSIASLAQQLKSIGLQHKLSDDQTVEMTLAFVQSITYDDSKAQKILAGNSNETMQYPYETLFIEKGVCSDKSLLAYSILKQMGYGVELLAFEQDNHMAIAIQCPSGYSNYSDGYCYAETTSPGNKIGIIPTFDAQSNKTLDSGQLVGLDPANSQQTNLKQLGQATVYQKIQGSQYSGIIATKKIENEIAQLSASITGLTSTIKNQKLAIDNEESDFNSLRSKLNGMKSAGNLNQFNAGVEKYNSLLEKYKNDVATFNNNVSLYNKSAQRYNVLISQ
jgi:hypothetical protein